MLKESSLGKSISSHLGKLLGWLPIHPNTLTISSVALAMFGYIAFFPSTYWYALSLTMFLFSFFFDAIDGAIARAKDLTSKEGAFLDGVADRFVEFFLLLTFLKIFSLNDQMQLVTFSILFFGTCMTVFVKAYAEHKGLLTHEKAEKLPGLLERAGRSILLLIAFASFAFKYGQIGIYILYLVAFLSFITFLQRFLLATSSKN